MAYVRNPKTGRKIKVGGPTYKKLKAKKVKFTRTAVRGKSVVKGRYSPKKKRHVYKHKTGRKVSIYVEPGTGVRRFGRYGPMTPSSQEEFEDLIIRAAKSSSGKDVTVHIDSTPGHRRLGRTSARKQQYAEEGLL